MTIKSFLLLCLIVIPLAPAGLYASEDHQSHGQTAGLTFQMDRYDFEVAITPLFYIAGQTPLVTVSLKQSNGLTPALIAEMYVLFDDNSSQPMAGMTMDMPPPATDKPAEAGFLDFDLFEDEAKSLDLTVFTRLEPTKMAGMYSAAYPLSQAGDYKFTLAVKAIDGKVFSEPLIYGTTIAYHLQSKAREYRLAFILTLIVLSTIVFLLVITARQRLNLKPGESLNLLDVRWIKIFFRSKWFQPVFQIPTFLVFVLVIFLGLHDIQAGDKNLATMLTWTIWWAGVIFTFVLLGRVWCMMCPFGAAQDIVGRRLSLNKNFPRPLRNIWLSTILFLALTWWDSYSGIVNKPALTAYLFIGFFGVSVVTALVYRGRTFCRYICPIGGLIGLYSMFSPLELRNKCLDVCRADTIKGCIRGTDNSHPCPMFETPMTLDRNNYCNLCSECIKSCAQDNIVLRFRSFAKDLWVTSKGYMDEAYLAMVLVGLTTLVTAEMIEPWHGWQDMIIKILPLERLGVVTHAAQETFVFSFLLVVGALILPSLLLLTASFTVKKLAGPTTGFTVKDIFVKFSYMFIPVGIAMHLAHNISHLLTEGQRVVPATQRALSTYAKLNSGIADWSLAPFMGFEAVFWLQMAVLVVLNLFSLYAGYRIAVKNFDTHAIKAFIPMLLLAVAFMLINVYILGQPMGMRHTH